MNLPLASVTPDTNNTVALYTLHDRSDDHVSSHP